MYGVIGDRGGGSITDSTCDDNSIIGKFAQLLDVVKFGDCFPIRSGQFKAGKLTYLRG